MISGWSSRLPQSSERIACHAFVVRLLVDLEPCARQGSPLFVGRKDDDRSAVFRHLRVDADATESCGLSRGRVTEALHGVCVTVNRDVLRTSRAVACRLEDIAGGHRTRDSDQQREAAVGHGAMFAPAGGRVQSGGGSAVRHGRTMAACPSRRPCGWARTGAYVMDFWAKVEHFKKDMKAQGGWWGLVNAVPPYLRLAWWLRIRARPPYFLGFWRGAALSGGGFAVISGLCMWLFVSEPDGGWAAWASGLTALLAGGLFGVLMALIWQGHARALGLSSWEDYPAGMAPME